MLARILLCSSVFAVFATPGFGQGEFQTPKIQFRPNISVRPPSAVAPNAVRPQAPSTSKPGILNQLRPIRPSFSGSSFDPSKLRPRPELKPQSPSQPQSNRWPTPRPQSPNQWPPTTRPPTNRPPTTRPPANGWPTPQAQPPANRWPRPSTPGTVFRPTLPTYPPGQVRPAWPTVPPQAPSYPRPPQVVQPAPSPNIPTIPSRPSVPKPAPKPDKVADENFKVPKPFPGFPEGEGPTKLDGGPFDGLDKLDDLRDELADAGKDKFRPFDHNKLLRDFSDLFGPGGLDTRSPREFNAAKKNMILQLSLDPYCHWWCDFMMHCHWHWHGCYWWDCCYRPAYWQCWTPCHYYVIHCPPTPTCVARSWYLGLDTILVPDMAALGVMDVQAGSPAAVAGIEPGDMIVAVNQLQITDETILAKSIQNSNGVIELAVIREGMHEPVWLDIAMELVTSY